MVDKSHLTGRQFACRGAAQCTDHVVVGPLLMSTVNRDSLQH